MKIRANDEQIIENELIRGRVSGRKADDDGKALRGAVYGLFPDGTSDYTEETAILTTTSKSDGSFSFENVPYGRYMVKELTALYGFVLNPQIYPVTIRSHGQVVEIESENKAQQGVIRVYKQGEIFATVTEKDGRYIPVYDAHVR